MGVRDGTDPIPEACNHYLASLPMLEAFMILSLWVLKWEDGVTEKKGCREKKRVQGWRRKWRPPPLPTPTPAPESPEALGRV